VSNGDQLNDFVARKRIDFEKAQSRHAKFGSNPTFNMRLRVRLGSKLNTDSKEIVTILMGRRVLIRSRNKDAAINSSEWIVFIAKRFRTIEAAARFGTKLQASASIAAAARGYAIDVGADNDATTQTSEIVKAAVAKEGGYLLDDVHGVDVFANLPNSMFFAFNATLSTSLNPANLIEALDLVSQQATKIDGATLNAALMINAAIFAPHPVAVIALFVASVESLASGERWEPKQKELIKKLKKYVEDSAEIDEIQKLELANAIGGLNFGALEKSRRLLRHLGLEDVIPRWEELYRGRSKLFHGTRYITVSDLQAMAGEASLICSQIFDAHLHARIKVI
jgi:hypothetical protein